MRRYFSIFPLFFLISQGAYAAPLPEELIRRSQRAIAKLESMYLEVSYASNRPTPSHYEAQVWATRLEDTHTNFKWNTLLVNDVEDWHFDGHRYFRANHDEQVLYFSEDIPTLPGFKKITQTGPVNLLLQELFDESLYNSFWLAKGDLKVLSEGNFWVLAQTFMSSGYIKLYIDKDSSLPTRKIISLSGGAFTADLSITFSEFNTDLPQKALADFPGWSNYRKQNLNLEQSLSNTLQVGMKAPNFSLKSMDGREWNLEKLRGSPTLIYFWAPNCNRCRQTLQDVKELTEELFTLSFISLGVIAEEAEVAHKVIEGMNLSQKYQMNSNEDFLMSYSPMKYPAFFLLDAGGTIQYIGDENGLEFIRTLVKEWAK